MTEKFVNFIAEGIVIEKSLMIQSKYILYEKANDSEEHEIQSYLLAHLYVHQSPLS